MSTMTVFDWVILVGLVLLVSIWLLHRIRSSLKVGCCSTDTATCAGCSGGCGKRNQTNVSPLAANNKKPD
ncbi:hypothetical protein CFI10_01500 [Marinobacterium iners]|uniref:hypothetical protein n=1 Tax=Marinobacterium iners TaxID=48076 RepID=UPI001A8ED31B|nr:hypothetical protein [Marinobacterium iners]QSR33678.1 hypothetical protein CFI10_01500 [Marinobacterium iners]